MENILIIVGGFVLVALVYLNTVATVIIFKAPDSALLLNVFRSLFVWLIPVIGFAFSLRFSQQSFDCELHYKLLPKFIQNWIYDDRYVPANQYADRRYGRALMMGLAHQLNNIRNKF